MLELTASFSDNLYTEMILEADRMPCLCKISRIFEIEFLVANPQVIGVVEDWNHRDIDMRVPAGAGGKYTHYSYGLISISKKETDRYIIENLSIFVLGMGWIEVIESREYTNIIEVEEPDWLKNM